MGTAVVRLSRIAPSRTGSRVLDLVVGSILIVLTCPLMLAVAIVVKLSSPGPVLFLQVRVSPRRDVPFTMLKFRTMRVSDDLEELLAGDEARTTRVGRLLRQTRTDELPQLFNVLRGDMSLLGPRPERVRFVP